MEAFQRLVNVYKLVTGQYKPTVGDIRLAASMINGSLKNHLSESETAPLANIYGVEKPVLQAADWVPTPHKPYAVIVREFYTNPLQEHEGWVLLRKTPRVGIYQKGDRFLLVLRGTKDGGDVVDDLTIAGYSNIPITLLKEGRDMIKDIAGKTKNITIVGHSLGGYSAQVLAEEYGVGCVAFNPAAPSLKPPKIGSGVGKSYVYHVVGDLVSTHTDPNKNTIVRIDTGLKYENTLKAHKMDSFLTGSLPPRAYLTAEQEDVQYNIFASTGAAAGSAFFGNLNVPIPGSLRDVDPKQGLIQTLDKNFSMKTVVETVSKPLLTVLLNTPSNGNSNLATIQSAVTNTQQMMSRVKEFEKKLNFKSSDVKMVNDVFGLLTLAKLPSNEFKKHAYNFYSLYSKVSGDAPLSLQSFEQNIYNPPVDLKKETNIEMLDIDPEVGSGTVLEMIKDATLPKDERLKQLQAIAANFDAWGTFNREEILEKIRTAKGPLPAWIPIPIFEGQVDINIEIPK